MRETINQEFLTTESVSEGHPDKISDQISEKILDFFLSRDQNAHVACEVFVTKTLITLGGEIKTNFEIDHQITAQIESMIYTFLKEEIGYNENSWEGLNQLKIKFLFNHQSKEIDQLISQKKHHIGAGDNCTVFGYANNDYNFFPIFQSLANQILKKINYYRKHEVQWQKELMLAPDGKIQIIYHEDKIIKIVLCQQFLKKLNPEEKTKITAIIQKQIIESVLKQLKIPECRFAFEIIDFKVGGPASDTGLTGRKIIVDAYGTSVAHGGGCLPGKDPSKTDKSLSLFARYVAKHIVALNLTEEITLQISSTIGNPKLLNITIIKTILSNHNQKQIKRIINQFFNWDLEEIINKLELKKQKFAPFASYGYFGHENPLVNWEKLDLLPKIKKELSKFN